MGETEAERRFSFSLRRSTLITASTTLLSMAMGCATFLIAFGAHQQQDRQQTADVQSLKQDRENLHNQLQDMQLRLAALAVQMQALSDRFDDSVGRAWAQVRREREAAHRLDHVGGFK